jgi:hypothetical protein
MRRRVACQRMSSDPEGSYERAEQIVRHAWRDLPPNDQRLLQTIGASQWLINVTAVGHAVDDLLPLRRPCAARASRAPRP